MPSPPRSILIVDDEFGLAEMLREMLRELGYEVQLAINGRVALEMLDERAVDLVITDMMMPVVDGNELAAAIRGSDRHRSIPIVMMTSLPSATPRAMELVDAVLRKPFTPDQLLLTMSACFARASDTAASFVGKGTTPVPGGGTSARPATEADE